MSKRFALVTFILLNIFWLVGSAYLRVVVTDGTPAENVATALVWALCFAIGWNISHLYKAWCRLLGVK